MAISNYPRIMLAGTNSGVGKTTIAAGIMLALKRRGLAVQSFKAGPDYIDPSYHREATGRPCANLDTWLVQRDAIRELFERRSRDADISVIEGVMGLYDGLRHGEEGSSAELAKVLNTPVILIMDCRSLSRSLAAAALGYKNFDKDVDIKGIILNNIGSDSHYKYTKLAIEKNTKIPVLGYLEREAGLNLPSRHLGLVPANEIKAEKAFYKKLAKRVEKNIDIDRMISIARAAKPFKVRPGFFAAANNAPKLKIAIARDKAFNFYYEDNLDIMRGLGARLVEFSPLSDKKLPQDISGIYIGGGFPEVFASRLSKNKLLKGDILTKAGYGLPIYAECGGLMYLMERLIDSKKKSFSMVGVFKGVSRMGKTRQALGYIEVETVNDNILGKRGAKTRAHAFHWSYLDSLSKDQAFAYRIKKAGGISGRDGLIREKVLASYSHLHFASDIKLAENFIKECRKYGDKNDKKDKQGV